MKKIILLVTLIPCCLFAQDRLTDGIYSSPDYIIRNTSSGAQNKTPVITGIGTSELKVSSTGSLYDFPRQAALNVYPNPAVSDARAMFTSQQNGIAYTIQMISQEGRSLLQQKGTTLKGTNIVRLNMSSYPTGTYYLQLFVGNRKETVNFVKLMR